MCFPTSLKSTGIWKLTVISVKWTNITTDKRTQSMIWKYCISHLKVTYQTCNCKQVGDLNTTTNTDTVSIKHKERLHTDRSPEVALGGCKFVQVGFVPLKDKNITIHQLVEYLLQWLCQWTDLFDKVWFHLLYMISRSLSHWQSTYITEIGFHHVHFVL